MQFSLFDRMKDAAAGLQSRAAEVAKQMTAEKDEEQYGEEEEGEAEQEEMEIEVPVKKKPKKEEGLKTIIENNTRVDTQGTEELDKSDGEDDPFTGEPKQQNDLSSNEVKQEESKKKKKNKKKKEEIKEDFNVESREELEARVEAYQTIVSENDTQILNLQQQLDESNTTNQEMQTVITEMRERIQELEQPEQNETNEETVSLRNQVKELTESLESARQELSEANTPKKIYESIIKEEGSIDNAQVARNNEELKALQSRLNDIQNSESANEEQAQAFAQREIEHSNEIAKLKEEYEKQLAATKSEAQTEIQQIKAQLELVDASKNEAEEDNASAIERMRSKMQTKIEALKKEKEEQLKNQLESLSQDKANALKDMETKYVEKERKAKFIIDMDKKTVLENHERSVKELKENYESQIAELKHEQFQRMNQDQEEQTQQQEQLEKEFEQRAQELEQTAMTKVHDALETLLRDTFQVEDGHRLSSMQSLQASQATLETLLEEFTQLVQQLEFSAGNSAVVEALSQVLGQAYAMKNQDKLEQYTSKARKDAMTWTQQRMKISHHAREHNMKLIQLFESQLATLFCVHLHSVELSKEIQEHRSQKETLTFQLQKLQKDNKEISNLSNHNQKLKSQIESQEVDKLSMQQKIQDALQERLSSKLRMSEQKTKMDQLIAENQSFLDKISEHEDDIKRLRKQCKSAQNQSAELEEAKKKIATLEDNVKWQTTQVSGKDSELTEVKQTVHNLQRAIQTHQEEYDEMAMQNEKSAQKYKQQINTLQNNVAGMEAKMSQISDLRKKVLELETKNESAQKEKLLIEKERDEVKEHARELVSKVKFETEGKEFMIDRRMINTFLIQFVNPKSDENTRHKMLDAMSKILGFSMEEKQQLGLVKKQSIDGKAEESKEPQGFRASLVSFLMGEDDFE